jgi:hypothetical protein
MASVFLMGLLLVGPDRPLETGNHFPNGDDGRFRLDDWRFFVEKTLTADCEMLPLLNDRASTSFAID